MIVYYILFTSAGIPFFLRGANKRLALIFLIFCMTLIGGLRYETGYDWLAYGREFDELDLSLGLLHAIKYNLFEPGYVGITYLIKLLGGSINTAFFLAAAFHSICFYKLISSQKLVSAVPLILFIGFSFLVQYMAIVRFSIASAFIYLAIIQLLKRNNFYYYLLILFASLFHVFALFMLPFAVLVKKEPRLWMLLASTAVAVVTGLIIGPSAILSIIGTFGSLPFLEKYAVYANSLEARIPVSVILFFSLNFFYCLMLLDFNMKYKLSSGMVTLSFWLSITTMLAITVGYAVPSVWNRIMCIAIPIQGLSLAFFTSYVSVTQKRIIYIITFLLSATAFSYTLIIQDTLFVPYESLIHKWLGLSSGIGRLRTDELFQ
jgi:hypothetical protein